MRLLSLDVTDFRNLALARIEPGPRFNVLHGDNAQGKTNLLEAIHLVAFLRSFRSRRARDVIRWDAEEARLDAHVEDGGVESRVRIVLRPGERVVELDGKRVRSPMSYYGLFRCVLFGPDDLDLTKGSPEARRRYLDRILFLSDPGFWTALKGYNEAVDARNRLLQQRETDARLFRGFEAQIAEHALGVLTRRKQVMTRVSAMLGDLVTILARWRDSGLKATYAPSVPQAAWTVEAYRERLEATRERDAVRGYTSIGPHKDDLELTFGNGRSFRSFASQGQHRLLAILLKITEMEVLDRITGSYPVLLLDDVSSELDAGHHELLQAHLERTGGQVFVTTTDREVLPATADIRYYRVAAGTLTGGV